MDDLRMGIVVEANSAGVGSGLRPGLLAIRDFDTQSGRHLKSLQDKMAQTRTVISDTFSSLSTNQKVFAGFGVGIALLGTGLAKSIRPAIEFESAFAGVRKTVDGTPAQLAAIRQGILDASSVMPTAADELASIAENAGQLGVKAPDVLEFTKVIAELGETTDLSFDEAAQSLARFLNITGSGAAGIGPVSDVIVKLGNNAATTESQIVDFSTRLASAFTVAGATEDQILGVASAFSSMGVRAEAGGSALSKVITVIGDAAIDGGKELEVLAETAGVTADEFRRLAAEDPTAALVLFAEGLGDIRDEGGSLTGVFEDLELGGLRTSEVLRLAAINSDLLTEQLGLANNAYRTGGARAEEYGKRIETTASRIEIFQNRLNTAAIALGTPLLDGFARSVDLAGDAVEFLLEQLAPLSREIFDLFDNGAQLAKVFYDALGGPALKVAVAALIGASSVLADLLGVLNQLGPAGFAIALLAADLYFVGPASIAAAKGLDSVAASGFRAAAGAKAATLAVSTGPWVAAVAVLALLGKAYLDAGEAARKAGDKWENSFNRAVENADFAAVESSLSSITKRQAELADQTGRSGGKWSEFVAGFKSGLGGGGSVQAIIDFQGLNTQLDTLEEKLASTQAENYTKGISLVAEALGITEDEAIATANELGVVDEVTRLGADAFTGYRVAERAVVDEMREHTTRLDDLADKTGIAREKILSGEAGLNDYADALEITTGQLGFLASKIDDVDLEDFLDEEKAGDAFDAVDSLLGAYSKLADEVGITTDQFVDQLESVSNLAAAHSGLRSAIDGTKSALQLMNEQQQIVATETKNVEEAFAELTTGEGSLIDAAGAVRSLTLEYAGSGVTVEQAIQKQRDMRAALIEAAVANGENRREVTGLVNELALVPEATIAEVVMEATQFYAENDEIQKGLQETGRRYDAEIGLTDLVSMPLDVVLADLNDFTVQDWIANLDANNQKALAAVAGATRETVTWENILAVADLDADGILAEEELERLVRMIENYKISDNTTSLDADGSFAENELNRMYGLADQYIARDNTTKLTADGTQAEQEMSEREEQASDLERTRKIRIEAVDVASSTLRAIREYYDNIPNTKTITVRTRSGIIQADGGIITHMAAGGLMDNAVRTRPGAAQIYSPITPGRFFAEPETGGEAYIPLAAGKRARSMSILRETARIFGHQVAPMADGGIQRFASGGITTRQFSNGPGEIPGILVDVQVDATSIGQVGVDLDPVNEVVARTARNLDSATDAADRLSTGTTDLGSSFVRTGATLEQTGRQMALALRPEEFLDTFSRISGWAKDSFEDWLGAWDGTVESAIAKLDEAQLPLGHIFRGIAKEGAVVGVDMVAAFERSGVQMTRIAEETGREMLAGLDPDPFFDTFTRISGWAKESFVDWLASWDESNVKAVEKLRESGASIDEIFRETFSAGEAIEALDNAGLEMSHIFRRVFSDGLTDAQIMDEAIGDIAGSMTDVEDATRRATDAFDLLTGASRSVLDSQLDYLDAVDRVREAIAGDEDDGPGVFGLVGEEARRNYQELVRAGDSMRDYGLAIAGSGVSAAEALKEFDGLREQFRTLASQTGLSKGEVDVLVETLFNVPKVTIAEIAIEGAQASTDIETLDGALKRLGELNIVPTIDASTGMIDAKTARILQDLGLIDESQPLPGVDANVDEFDARIAGANKAIDDLDGRVAETIVRNTIKTSQTVEYTGGTYTVQSGDSWWAMAAKLWGDPTRYRELAAKNKADPSKTIYPGMVIKFAAGGMVAPISEKPGRAGIYGPAAQYRIFSEPETGGEAYIPLSPWKRARSMRILGETANRFGARLVSREFADGGISGATPIVNVTPFVDAPRPRMTMRSANVTISAPINVEITAAPGMDEAKVGTIAGEKIRQAFEDWSTDLENMFT